MNVSNKNELIDRAFSIGKEELFKKTFFTIAETADFLDISLNELKKLMKENSIPYYMPHKNMCYFFKDEIIAWIKKSPIKENSGLMTLKQAMGYLKVGQTTLRKLVREGDIACCKAGGNLRFEEGDLKEYIQSKKLERVTF